MKSAGISLVSFPEVIVAVQLPVTNTGLLKMNWIVPLVSASPFIGGTVLTSTGSLRSAVVTS